MAYVVTDNCIKCKYTDCVAVCPVDCFYEGENMLVINPIECIDCGVCEPECPAGAIKMYTEDTPELKPWLNLNTKYSAVWPNIATMRPHEQGAEDYDGEPGKLNKYFSTKPGTGV